MDRAAIKRLAFSANRQEKREAKRILNKRLRPGGRYKTGLGRGVKIVGCDEDYVYLRHDRGEKEARVPFYHLVCMVSYFLRVRITERKELEVFHSYSSALFGLLMLLFKERARLFVKKYFRLIMNNTRIYLAGSEKSPRDLKMAIENGARYILLSYYWIRGSAWKERIKQHGLRCLLDCGSFSAWYSGKEAPCIDGYIDFIKKHEDLIEHYFVMDAIGDHEKTMENLRYMEDRGLSPVPVFHMGTPIEELEPLVQEYPVVALGGLKDKPAVKDFLSQVFSRHKGAAFHGLSVGKADFLNSFCFFSTDTTSWMFVRRKEKVLTEKGQVSAPDIYLEDRLRASMEFLGGMEKRALARVF